MLDARFGARTGDFDEGGMIGADAKNCRVPAGARRHGRSLPDRGAVDLSYLLISKTVDMHLQKQDFMTVLLLVCMNIIDLPLLVQQEPKHTCRGFVSCFLAAQSGNRYYLSTLGDRYEFSPRTS